MANSAVDLRSNHSHLYGSSQLPVLEEIMKYELSQHDSVRDRVFKKVGTESDIYQSSELHDLTLFEAVPENSAYSFDRAKQGAAKTFNITKYGAGFSITEEMMLYGKFNLIGDLVRMLAKSAKESQEVQAMNVLNNGFTTETTADGVALFSTAHTLPSGGTYRNKRASDADLSESSLQDAVADFKSQFVGDSGIIYRVRPKILLVHTDSENAAHELVGSSLKPGGDLNNINSIRRDGLTVIASPHLTDTDSWYLLADPMETGLRVIERRGLSTKASGPDAGFMTDSMFYKANYFEKVGAVHAVGAWGSTGA